MVSFALNGRTQSVDRSRHAPLLWVLRDALAMTGTQCAYGIVQCSAGTVRLDPMPIRARITPVAPVSGKHLTTTEGRSLDRSHLVQRAWIAEHVPPCGYCQSGPIIPSDGLGEPGVPPLARAIGNAIFVATDQRLRILPMGETI